MCVSALSGNLSPHFICYTRMYIIIAPAILPINNDVVPIDISKLFLKIVLLASCFSMLPFISTNGNIRQHGDVSISSAYACNSKQLKKYIIHEKYSVCMWN